MPANIRDSTFRFFRPLGHGPLLLARAPQLANLVKLSGNYLIASFIEALGEAMSLIGKGGIDRHQYLDILTSTLFSAPIYKTYGGLIADVKFRPAGFAAPLGDKDTRLALAAAEDLHVSMPLASLLNDRFHALLAKGGEKLNWSAIARLAAYNAGEVNGVKWIGGRHNSWKPWVHASGFNGLAKNQPFTIVLQREEPWKKRFTSRVATSQAEV